MKNIVKQINSFTSYTFHLGDKIDISVKAIILLIIVLALAKYFLGIFERVTKKRLVKENRNKFDTVFSFGRWLIYIIIFLVTLNSAGVNVNAIFAASAALLIGVGLALQTWFQDIMSGIFIILDQSVHVGDIIELNDKIGRVEEIRLRTTRAVTIDNKVLIIPNHLYLTTSLYNWTQNGTATRESISVGVAYGSDIVLVKELLLKVAHEHPKVMTHHAPIVLFEDFGDNALKFKLIFTLNDSYKTVFIQSDLRFKIIEIFREHKVTIPFPQRDIHIIK